jgi:GPH family glycoside/pentoside/hexuronide:cation symporter
MSEKKFDDESARHSRFTYFSFAFFQFPASLIIAAQTVALFFYYETSIGLNAFGIFIAFSIATVWDAVNDPLIGYLTDRNTRLTKKWGRRFPWIVFGIIPWSFSLILLYMPPAIDPVSGSWLLIGYLAFALCFFDTFHTLLYVQIVALRADKFRTEKERRKITSLFVPIDAVASVTGMILPPIFLAMGEGNEGIAIMAIMMSIITLISCFIFLPGTREDETMINRYSEAKEYKRMNFIQGLKELLKSRAFIIFMLAYIFFEIAMGMLTANSLYLAAFVLGDADLALFILLLFLIGAVISAPVWVKVLKKLDNNKKVFVVGGLLTCAALIPVTFHATLIDLLIFTFILGFCLGSLWSLVMPVIQPNVLDDFVVRTQKDQKGVLIGITTFIVRLTATLDELILATVHALTGFVEGIETYDEMLAVVGPETMIVIQWGIRVLMGIIPAIILFVGMLIFWKFYPLTQDKVHENKAKLAELSF